MIKWSRRHALVAGLTLILATNAVALLGVAYNRSGEPESSLTLTQRELRLPYSWGFQDENSGFSFSLEWRVLMNEIDNYSFGISYRGTGGAPAWLDKNKLAALGFDIAPAQASDERWYDDKTLAKEVLLVLELDGAAYQTALERTRQYWRKQTDALAANPDNREGVKRVQDAKQRVEQEERNSSRLFVVDAGIDRASLRAQYPDRNRYAIVRGRVRPQLILNKNQRRMVGYVSNLSIDRINLPLSLQAAFAPKELRVRTRPLEPRIRDTNFEATVAFGQRLEPWITSTKSVK